MLHLDLNLGGLALLDDLGGVAEPGEFPLDGLAVKTAGDHPHIILKIHLVAKNSSDDVFSGVS